MSVTSAIKRIINKDIKELQNLNLDQLGIYINFDESNMLKANAIIIGPKDSPYENGILYFQINFPKDYPFSPPNIYYYSRSKIRIHPNLYIGKAKDDYLGKVCLSVINTWSGPKWTSIMHIGSILISIQSLLDNNPIRYEPGFEKETGELNNKYNEIVKYDTFRNLIFNNYKNIPNEYKCFNDIIEDHISKNKKDIFNHLERISKDKNVTFKIDCNIYHIYLNINYPELLNQFKQI